VLSVLIKLEEANNKGTSPAAALNCRNGGKGVK
jgi:hypothetical protein